MELEGSAAQRLFPDESELRAFQSALVGWFTAEGKSYPWRETTDPYAILVSELMLQQTQIATVLGKGYYQRWLDRFPDVESLAAADEVDLLKAWEGLGYYNRARNLQKAAAKVVNDFGGSFPDDYESVMSLPGVGRYTAGAVMSFAFNQRAPIVDGNVTRVLARLFGRTEPVDSPDLIRFFWEVAEVITPDRQAREFNSAIMELGQRICSRSSPSCDLCPVKGWCVAQAKGETESIPAKKKRVKTVLKEERIGLTVKQGRIFLTEEKGSRRRGLWRLPEITAGQSEDLVEAFRFEYAITKYKVTLRSFLLTPALIAEMTTDGEGQWFPLLEEKSLPPMGAPYLKVIRKYQNLHDELNLSS